MSSTNKTTYYELPQFVDNDIFNPLVDDNDAYDKIDTALHNIADAEAENASEIVGIKSRLDSAEGSIDALEAQNGDSVLTTEAQTLSGAINELDADVSALDGRLDIVEDDINNASTGLKVKVNANTTAIEANARDIDNLELQNGNDTLDTVAQTLSGAINELNENIILLGEFVTPEMYGAKGDGVTDDHVAIQNALDSGKNVLFGAKVYNIGTSTISIEDPEEKHTLVVATGSTILYTGTDYAIRFRRINNKTVILGVVLAEAGSCVQMLSEDYTIADKDRVQYLNLTFESMKALHYCVHAKVANNVSWVNEIRLQKGRFEAGEVGLYLEKATNSGYIDGWRVSEIGIEGVAIGVHVNGGQSALGNAIFDNCRCMEVPSQFFFKTTGRCFNMKWNCPDHVSKQYFSIDDLSYGIEINAPLYSGSAGGGPAISYHTLVGRNNKWIYDIVESIEDIVYNANVSVNTGATRVRRIGFWMSLKIYLNNVTLDANEAVCTLPFAPVALMFFTDNNGNVWYVDNAGKLAPQNALTNVGVVVLNVDYIYYTPLY